MAKDVGVASDGNSSSYLLVEADTTISGHFLWAEMEIILSIHFYPPKYAHRKSPEMVVSASINQV